MLVVLSLALQSTWRDASSLFRNPSLLLRSLLAMNVFMPIFAATLVGLFTLSPAVEIALLALSVSPVPPFRTVTQLTSVAEREREYVHGLLGTTALLSIVLAPLTVLLIGLVFSHRVDIEPVKIARVVALTVFVPLAVGLVVHHLTRPSPPEQVPWQTRRAFCCS
jgi:bile acid:Na+ symporter, BASS family